MAVMPSDASGEFNAHLSFNAARTLAAPSAKIESEKHRSKLTDIGQRFIGFDKVVEEDTVKRRMVEMQRIQAVHEGVLKLEKALNVEIRRRVDANKMVQSMTESFANDMLDRLQAKILQRLEKLAVSLESLMLRCSALEKGISQFRGEMPSKIQVDTAALVKEIAGLRQHMEGDKKHRVDRDTQFLKRIAEVEYTVDTKFENNLTLLSTQCSSVQKEVESLSRTDESSEEQFRAFILEEIAALKNVLAMTSQAREQTDDEIVQAINQYTNALQKGLRAANLR